jgi:hypothetical protein
MTRESDNMGLVPYKLDPDSSVNSRQHLIAKTTAQPSPYCVGLQSLPER